MKLASQLSVISRHSRQVEIGSETNYSGVEQEDGYPVSMKRNTTIQRTIVAISILLGCIPVNASSEPVCADLEAAKLRTFGFLPSHLSGEEQRAKSQQLDQYWQMVKAKGQTGVDCLRRTLLAEQKDVYFAFDAANLLYSLDKSSTSLEAVFVGLSRTNLKELNASGFIALALALSERGMDISALAEKYITAPSVDGYVAMHAMKLDRETAAVFLYGHMSPATADKSLVRMLDSKESYARSTAALLLAFNMTADSFKALKASNRTAFPAEVRSSIDSTMKYSRVDVSVPAKMSRAEVLGKLKRIPNYDSTFLGVAGDDVLELSALAVLKEDDLETLREARRKSLVAVSDEALGEYFALSKILLGVINRLDLYKDYREY